MSYEHISISLPRGYAQSLDEESSRYGLNRSELIRVLCDGYFYATAEMIKSGKRESIPDPKTKLHTFFPEVLPHRREEADKWLHDYLRLVIRIHGEAVERKEKTGSVEADSIYDLLP